MTFWMFKLIKSQVEGILKAIEANLYSVPPLNSHHLDHMPFQGKGLIITQKGSPIILLCDIE